MSRVKKTSVIVALVASAIQHLEYAIFGISASILSKEFFPPLGNNSKFIGFYIIILIPALLRPLGSLIFGRYGDIIGRSHLLKLSMMISALSTIAIGLIPSYEQIGGFSVLLLLIFRSLFIMTGQVDNTVIYVSEIVGKKRENFVIALVSVSIQIGIVIGHAVFWASSLMNIYFLWRLNFIFSGIAGILVLLLKVFLVETSEFINKNKINNSVSKKVNFFKELIKEKEFFIKALIIHGAIGSIYTFFVIYLSNYLVYITFLVNKELIAYVNIFSVILCTILAPVSGYLADKYDNIKFQIKLSIIISIILMIIFLLLLKHIIYNYYIHIMIVGLYPFYTIPCLVLMKRHIKVNVRVRIYGFAHSIGSIFISTPTQLVCTLIWDSSSMLYYPLIYPIIVSLLFLLSVRRIK